MIEVKESRPPFIEFEKRAVEDRTRSIAEGKWASKDVDFVCVTPAGSKDRMECEVANWFSRVEQSVKDGRVPATWFEHYKHSYKLWQTGQEIPLNGTPIRTWPPASPSEAKRAVDMGILTVEDAAEMNEECLGRFGMGGRSFKQRAADWIAATKTGKAAGELTTLRAENANLKIRLDSLEKQIAGMARPEPPKVK